MGDRTLTFEFESDRQLAFTLESPALAAMYTLEPGSLHVGLADPLLEAGALVEEMVVERWTRIADVARKRILFFDSQLPMLVEKSTYVISEHIVRLQPQKKWNIVMLRCGGGEEVQERA